ncbi:MAG TPA: hypothetical protein ENK50_06450 [Sedimenticola sp.]|nr:hypothetical protein [Sedimenticola sp.]
MTADPVRIEVLNNAGDALNGRVDTEFLVRLVYRGKLAARKLQALQSDDGERWNALPEGSVVFSQPADRDDPGQVVIRTRKLGYLTVVDKKGPVIASCMEPDACGL